MIPLGVSSKGLKNQTITRDTRTTFQVMKETKMATRSGVPFESKDKQSIDLASVKDPIPLVVDDRPSAKGGGSIE